MKKTTEADVLRACLDLLRLRGILAWRANNTGIYDPSRKRFRSFHGLKGVSDILGILPPNGRLIAVETKRPGERPTAAQAAFLERVEALGGVGAWVSDVGELVAILNDLGV